MSMETLVVVAQHRNQYYSRSKGHGSDRFGSSPSRDFREINCRSFESGAGILPTPLKACTTPVAKGVCPLSQKTPSSNANSQSEGNKHNQAVGKSSAISIPFARVCNYEKSFHEDLSYSELWAGPAYSNSPPPSSLPIPKFSVRPKRTVSLELPGSAPVIKMHLIAKSAPPSPTRESYPSPREFTDFATKNLRRILNLDIADD